LNHHRRLSRRKKMISIVTELIPDQDFLRKYQSDRIATFEDQVIVLLAAVVNRKCFKALKNPENLSV